MEIFFLMALVFLLEGFFSGSETALISMNILRMEHLIEKKNKLALAAHDLIKKPDKLLATTLIGANLMVVINSALATSFFERIAPDKAALLATCTVVPLSLIFGELIPKTVYRYYANAMALRVSYPLRWVQIILYPAVILISFIASKVNKLVNPKGVAKNPLLTKEEIQIAIREIQQQGVLNDKEKDYIDRIFEFTLTKVGDITVPLNKVASVDYNDSRDSLIAKSRQFGFTRFPVFQDKVLKGVINIYDLFFNGEIEWHTFVRPLRNTHIEEHLDRLFSLMQPGKESMAAVFKENVLIGIVTLEDLIEEINRKL